MQGGDIDWKAGRSWSLVYYAGEEHHRVVARAHDLYLSTNALNPMAFKSLRRMEAEVVQMTASLFHAPETAVGTMTSGGTESLLLAVKAARDLARAERPWVRRPNMVVPSTIHAAFDKAAHYFGVRRRTVPVGADLRADPRRMARAIDRNTVLVAASAPQYPHGVVDPIVDLAPLAARRGIPFHVDACFGGFLLPFAERLGHALPTWDFRVPGVTSISADAHKYGYAPKGASVLVYRGMRWLRRQFFVSTTWSGGIYVSPGIAGSRPGGPIAAAWASLIFLGEDGLLALTREAMETARRLREGVSSIPGLAVLGAPHSTIVAWRSLDPGVDIFQVADRLALAGWGVDRQQAPPCIHCTVAPHNAPAVDRYLEDVRAAVAWARAHPDEAAEGEAAIYGTMAKLPARSVVAAGVMEFMESLYGPGAVEAEVKAPEGGVAGAVRRHGRLARSVLDRVESAREAWERRRR